MGRTGRLVRLLGNRKLRERIFFSQLILGVIPLALVGWLNYRTAVTNLSETMTDFINLFASQLSSEIENEVLSVDNLSKSLLSDTDALRFLSSEAQYVMSQRVAYRRAIDTYIANMVLQKPDLLKIYLIGASGVVYHSGNPDGVLTEAYFMEQDWYRQMLAADGRLILAPQLSGTEQDESLNVQSLIIGRALRDAYGTIRGVVAYEIKMDNIIRTNPDHRHIIEEYDIGIGVRNAAGEPLYRITSESLGQEPADSRRAVVLTSHIEGYDLTVTIMIPRDTLFRKLYLMRNLNLLVVLAVIVATQLLSLLLSYHVTRPLSSLSRSMQLFEARQYVPIPETGRTDELGALISTYNRMITRINTLIQEVYVTKLHERRAQLAALQSQINPHMLYNTLECIRMKAALNDDPEVADMIRDLGRMFQMALAQDQEHHTVADELEHVTVYVRLLSLRYDGRYRLEAQLGEPILRAPLLRFIFQPIVENSIVHGFGSRPDPGVIRIEGEAESGGLRLRIADNGRGMTPGRLAAVRRMLEGPEAVEGNGLGLKNVYDRIRLAYGEPYTLEVDAEAGRGTTVTLLIPRGPDGDGPPEPTPREGA